MILTEEERERFITYLEMSIESGMGIIEQFEKLPGGMHDAMAKRFKTEVAAEMVVVAKLRTVR